MILFASIFKNGKLLEIDGGKKQKQIKRKNGIRNKNRNKKTAKNFNLLQED